MPNTRLLSALGLGDDLSFASAITALQAIHNYSVDGMAYITEIDGGEYITNVDVGGIAGVPTLSAYLKIQPAVGKHYIGQAGNTHTRVRNNGASNQSFLITDDFVHIGNIEFILNSNGNSHECIRYSSQSNILIDNSLFRSVSKINNQDAIYSSTTSNAVINNCNFYGFGRAAIHVQNSAGSHEINVNSCTAINCGFSSGGEGTGFIGVRNNTGSVNVKVTNCAGFKVTTAGNVYNQYGTDVSNIIWSGSNNVANDTSAESKFTSSYNSVSLEMVEPVGGENFWISSIINGAEDLEIAGENAFTVSQHGITPTSADPRADYTVDVALNARKSTPTIGAYEYITGGSPIIISASDVSLVAINDVANIFSLSDLTDTLFFTIDDMPLLLGLSNFIDTLDISVSEIVADLSIVLSAADSISFALAEAQLSTSFLTRSDALALTVVELVSIYGTITASDGLDLSIAETVDLFNTLIAGDSLSASITDGLAVITVALQLVDALDVTMTDTAITLLSLLSRSDDLNVSVNDVSVLLSILNRSDDLSLSVDEQAQALALINAIDTLSVFITDQTLLAAIGNIIGKLSAKLKVYPALSGALKSAAALSGKLKVH